MRCMHGLYALWCGVAWCDEMWCDVMWRGVARCMYCRDMHVCNAFMYEYMHVVQRDAMHVRMHA